ncbi:kinase-like domain-containing protein [Rhizophagus irregularis DAOM 181602=DAOM 197198]|nr:kinase-like domain-containing protein [Rhizophagus irregularis DAOM 181602=DAOM 197198]
MPNTIVEWIPYSNLQNIKYLTKGGFSEIYTADWIGGGYDEWDSKKQQLRRFGTTEIVLKKLENIESANQSWFEEAKSHLTINNKWAEIVRCYEYKNLMVQCWDADPLKRPDVLTLCNKIREIHLSYQNMPDELFQSKGVNNFEIKTSTNYISSRLFTSKVHQFENLPEPKNATEEEQEAFHSKTYDFNIPDNIEDFNNSNDQKINKTSKINSIFKGDSKRLSEEFKSLQISSNNDIQNDYKKETMQQMRGSVNDDDEIHNNPNLHSEDQDEFEIPDDGF